MPRASPRSSTDAIITGCGNATLVIVIGALERLWSLHERAWADYSHANGDRPDHPLRQSVLEAHEAITDAIDEGDPRSCTNAPRRTWR